MFLLMEGHVVQIPTPDAKVRELLKSGVIGEIKSLHADFGSAPHHGIRKVDYSTPLWQVVRCWISGMSILFLFLYDFWRT